MKDVNKTIEQIIRASNVAKYAREYKQYDMLVIKDFLPPEFVIEHFVPEVEHCKPFINRVYVPGFKKSGSVSAQHVKQYAPHLFAFYHLDAVKQFIENIVGQALFLCPQQDPHACALYHYTEPHDHIGFHYDKSFYRGKRYTVLLGLIQDSAHSNLVCYPGSKTAKPMTVATTPGTLIIFNGDVLWHKVTPLAENETRIILTLEFVTDTRMTLVNKFISNFKDRFLYFGKQPAEIV